MRGKPDPKPEFRDEMTGFRKARRFQRDYLAIIDFYNVGTGLSIQSTGRRVLCMDRKRMPIWDVPRRSPAKVPEPPSHRPYGR
jgi:hypothetical protein